MISTKDCDCNPPPPELSSLALSWMLPYQNQSHFIFISEIGLIDTVAIQFESDTEFCGVDECGIDCDVQIASLTTLTHPEFDFTISAKDRSRIMVNNIEDFDSTLFAELNTENQNVFGSNEKTTIILEHNFQWNNRFLTVLKIDCNDPVNCSKYKMTNMIISKEEGLIQYIYNSSETWQKQD